MKRTILHRLVVLIVCLTFVPVLWATKPVKYLHKVLSLDGCYVEYRVAKQESSFYIVVVVDSERLRFLSEPTMKVRTFDDEVLTFPGTIVDQSNSPWGFVSGHMVLPFDEITSIAQFRVTPQEFEKLKRGISKVRLSMTPENHERTFKKDKMGKKLYKLFLQSEVDDF